MHAVSSALPYISSVFVLGRLVVAVSLAPDMASSGQRTSWELLSVADIALSVLLRNARDALHTRQDKVISRVGGSIQSSTLVLLLGFHILIFYPRISFFLEISESYNVSRAYHHTINRYSKVLQCFTRARS
jgi:hypothetical protein